MFFQILDNNGNLMDMNELDKEAAAFFGVETDDEFYVGPTGPSPLGNWFEHIGGAIATMPNRQYSWSAIIGNICNRAASMGSRRSAEDVLQVIKRRMPYIELCFHWEAKGYVPVSA